MEKRLKVYIDGKLTYNMTFEDVLEYLQVQHENIKNYEFNVMYSGIYITLKSK